LIIGCRFMLKLLMGIMAGHTGETRVAVAPALAVFQTIRLKARVDGSGDANLHFVDVGPRTMTGAAEVYRSDWAERTWIENLQRSGFSYLAL